MSAASGSYSLSAPYFKVIPEPWCDICIPLRAEGANVSSGCTLSSCGLCMNYYFKRHLSKKIKCTLYIIYNIHNICICELSGQFNTIPFTE